MPYYAIVVKDAQLAHAQEIARNVEHNVSHHGEAHRKRIDTIIRSRFQAPRDAGTLHAHGERGCPDGESWCEHCGDPSYRDACLAAGHCAACVTLQHGAVAHPEVLAAHGYELIEVEAPTDGQVWHPGQRQFVKS